MVRHTLHLKRLGKKKIYTVQLETDLAIRTGADLVEACIRSEVVRFNKKRDEPFVSGFLLPSEIQDQAEMGKVSFGAIFNDQKADADTALEAALLAHKDGLFAIFLDDEEITLDSNITLQPESEITFIRLTFLTGTRWRL